MQFPVQERIHRRVMLLIVIIAFLATVGFFRRAKQIGVHPGKAASIPFLSAGLMLIFNILVGHFAAIFLAYFGVSDSAIDWNVRVMELVLILSYCYYISRNWKMLNAATGKTGEEAPNSHP